MSSLNLYVQIFNARFQPTDSQPVRTGPIPRHPNLS